MFRVTRYPMISKTESGWVGYQKNYRVAGRVRVPAGHCKQPSQTFSLHTLEPYEIYCEFRPSDRLHVNMGHLSGEHIGRSVYLEQATRPSDVGTARRPGQLC